MKVKVHIDNGFRKVLDSRPIVENVNGYCAASGSNGGGKYCDTRPEGSTQREACDALVVGRAKDTGRIGPTWTRNGRPCSPVGAPEGSEGCLNHPDNQFLVIARGGGDYLACAPGPDGEACAGLSF
jgi:hypothetical protein